MNLNRKTIARALPFLLVSKSIVLAESPAAGGEDMAEIAKKLNNPVASLINVPFQNNVDFGGGPDDDGYQYKLNFQPVIPIALNEHWELISRTIIPYIDQDERIGDTDQSGLGDIAASFFFSPKETQPGGITWGVGPIISLPTGTDDLSTEQWAAGPTVLILKQQHGWTCGALASHLWTVGGSNGHDYVSLTSLQPFLSYTTPKHTTFGMNLESTYDWNAGEWTVPVNAFITQLVKFGSLPVSFQFGGRYYLDKPTGGPDWGLRFAVTFVIPEG